MVTPSLESQTGFAGAPRSPSVLASMRGSLAKTCLLGAITVGAVVSVLRAEEDLGAMWGTAQEEAKYYPIVDIPIPSGVPLHPGGLEVLPDGRLAVGTRRGDIYFVRGPSIRHRAPNTTSSPAGRMRSSRCRGRMER